MSWSLPTITAKTRAAAAAKAVAAFLTQTAEQTGHDRDRHVVVRAIQDAVYEGLENEPNEGEQVVISGNGHATGGYEYPDPQNPGQTIRTPCTGVSITLNVAILAIPAPAPATK